MTTKQNNPARRHHILPQLLLKRFAKDGQVWVTDRINQNSFCTNIDNAACMRDYYTVETTGEIGIDCIEQGPLAEIENLAEPIINKMLQEWSTPKSQDWEILANFLALMYCRGPFFRTILKIAHEQGANILDDYIHSSEEIFKLIMGKFCKMQGIEISYEEALRARKESELYVDIPNTYFVTEMLNLAICFVPVFVEMTPNMEKIDTMISDAKFVISDCPIVPISRNANPPKGWRWYRNPNADLFFPVSSKACLVLNYDRLRKVTNVNRKRVGFVNHVMALNSERVIISEEQEFVWRRANGTTSSSREELFEFLKESPRGGPSVRLDYDKLRQHILKELKQRKIGNHPL
jgi:hypothetical protein